MLGAFLPHRPRGDGMKICEECSCTQDAEFSVYGVACCGEHLHEASSGLVFLNARNLRGMIDHSALCGAANGITNLHPPAFSDNNSRTLYR